MFHVTMYLPDISQRVNTKYEHNCESTKNKWKRSGKETNTHQNKRCNSHKETINKKMSQEEIRTHTHSLTNSHTSCTNGHTAIEWANVRRLLETSANRFIAKQVKMDKRINVFGSVLTLTANYTCRYHVHFAEKTKI